MFISICIFISVLIVLCSCLRGHEVCLQFVVEKSNVTQRDIIVLWTSWFPH